MSNLLGKFCRFVDGWLRDRSPRYAALSGLRGGAATRGRYFSSSEGKVPVRFDELVRYEVLQRDLDSIRLRVEAFPRGSNVSFLLFQQVCILREQLFILKEADGKVLQVYTLYILCDCTWRIEALNEQLTSFDRDLMPLVNEPVSATV